MQYAVIDVDTTGLRPSTDRVVEAACVIVDDGVIVRTWSSLVNPARPIPEYATRVHGISDADVANAPPFAHVQHELFRLCKGRTVVAHNASFDLSFLPLLQRLPSLCTLKLARLRYPDAPNHKNQTLRTYLHIDALLRDAELCHPEVSKDGRGIEALPPHRALADALVTAGILLRCLPVPYGGLPGDRVRKSA